MLCFKKKAKPIPQNWIDIDPSKSVCFTKLVDSHNFVESCACNAEFDISRGDGKKNIYVPVQESNLKLSIRSIDMNNLGGMSEHVMDIDVSEYFERGSTLSGFGSKLSNRGIFWMCVFNMNSVIAISLIDKKIIQHFNHIPGFNSYYCRQLYCFLTILRLF